MDIAQISGVIEGSHWRYLVKTTTCLKNKVLYFYLYSHHDFG